METTVNRKTIAAVAALASLQIGIAHAQNPQEDGGLSLLITYQTAPANRPVLRHELKQATAPELARWKHDGRITQYELLFNRYADSDNWDAMALLTFATPEDLYRWRTIEQEQPAALSMKGLAVTTSIHTAPVDMKRASELQAKSPNPVYVFIPYKTEVSADDYVKYADGYVIPQFKGWMDEGVLSGYSLYMAQFPAARNWDVVAVLKYNDEAALSRREAVVAKVRAQLAHDSAWKAISDNKKSVRAEEQVVIADPVAVSQ
jgi:hypothetical protein